MSPIDHARIREAFDHCIGIDGEARNRALDALGLNETERAEVESLLAAHATAPARDEVERRIQSAAAASLPARDRRVRMGPWRITGELGEGGMGVVLAAVRDDGEYEQRAAIKLIRGYASDAARDRLRRERQILADLEHPNIARLLDGGTSRSGEPYLVMEYVDGELLPAWLAGHPPLRARVRLFASVCRAVAFAHQRLVIHRDLKPGNVMVRPDGVPVLLDFGIAKLIDDGSRPGEATRTRAMTPAFASPEQLRGESVTTASDVYALGLLLYVLLGGDIQRRGTLSGEFTGNFDAASNAARASSDPTARSFAPELRGDLDAIVRLATRHDPTRRYASVILLQQDIEAWLDGRPVAARAGDRWYLLRMFARRQRVPLALSAILLAAGAYFVLQLAAERDRARAAEVQALAEAASSREVVGFVTGLFSELDARSDSTVELSARELLDRGRARLDAMPASTPRARAALQRALGNIYRNSERAAPAIELLTAARATYAQDSESIGEVVAIDIELANMYNAISDGKSALPIIERALALAESRQSEDPATFAHALMTHGVVVHRIGRVQDAVRDFERARVLFAGLGDAGLEGLSSVLHNRGWVADSQNDHAAALVWYEKAVAAKRALLGNDHPKTLNSRMAVAGTLASLDRLAEAEAMLEELAPDVERRMGPLSTVNGTLWNELASVRQDLGRYAESAAAYGRALEIARQNDKDQTSPMTAQTINNLATLDEDRGDLAASEAGYRRSLEVRVRTMPPASVGVARAQHNLARVLLRTGRLDEAASLIDAALTSRTTALSASNYETLATRALRAELLLARGDRETAVAEAQSAVNALAASKAPARATASIQRALARTTTDSETRIAALRAARAALASALPAEHPMLALAALDLADALSATAPDESKTLRAFAIPILDAALAPASPDRNRLRTSPSR